LFHFYFRRACNEQGKRPVQAHRLAFKVDRQSALLSLGLVPKQLKNANKSRRLASDGR
jgi:hypothetical protein